MVPGLTIVLARKILVDYTFSMSQQWATAAKANAIVSCMNRNTDSPWLTMEIGIRRRKVEYGVGAPEGKGTSNWLPEPAQVQLGQR